MALVGRLLRRSTILKSRPFHREIAMSSVRLRTEEAVEELKAKNPYFEKYSAKMAALQQAAPEEFLEKVAKVVKPAAAKAMDEKPRDYSELLHPKADLSKKSSEIPHKQLADIMKIELVQDKTAEEIKHIWIEYHKQKEVLIATIPVDQYDLQMSRGKTNPMFIVPLPRSEGFEFFLFQFAANTVHFTPLLCYQVHKENAPECLNIVHYTELRDKGIILMRGEFDKNVINAQEAQCLANQLQLYYAQNNATKLKILDTFTNKPELFKHTDVIHELANLTL